MSELVPRLQRHRALVAILADLVAWLVAYLAVGLLRYMELDSLPWRGLALVAVAHAVVYLGCGRVVRLHHGRTKVASLEDMMLLGTVAAVATVPVFLVNLVPIWVPRSIPVGAAVCAVLLMSWTRASWRRLHERDLEHLQREGASRVLVLGAGSAGYDLIGSMQRDPERAWRPVGILDDDPHKRHRRLRGVPVVGTLTDLAEQARRLDVDVAVLAIPSASSTMVQMLGAAGQDAGIAVKVLPPASQMLDAPVGVRDIRDIDLTDVLGRKQLDTDVATIGGFLAGRRVLVTGAGGSIGSELCRQISRFDPERLLMLDRDESALHAVQLSLTGRALLDDESAVLCDIRDADALGEVFDRHRPEVVFHAAALKHLPMLESHPGEAVKTNVVGTRNVLEAARRHRVARFVNVSTDKAANPSSVLGYSKRVAERVTAQYADGPAGTYVSVRFGNVLGSRGSVLTTFARQIAAGGPVTVTDPDVTRYFMTIEEACQLVIQAAAIGASGEALVLDMGDPVRIADVAEQLIDQSGRDVAIEYTGLRPGEKVAEELFADAEPQHHRPRHDLVSHVPVPAVSAEQVAALPEDGDPVEVRRSLASLCLEWQPAPATAAPEDRARPPETPAPGRCGPRGDTAGPVG